MDKDRKIKKVLLDLKENKKYFIKDLDNSFHTSSGMISVKDLNSEKGLIFSNKNQPFALFEPSFVDLWENLQRGPQIIQHKDIGLILAKTGVNKNSKTVDAGGGSGSLCLTLANICKKVTTYENNPLHLKVLENNKQMFGFSNLEIKNQNIYEGIKEKNVDLITLDLPEPWQAVKHAEEALKKGGYLVVYLPNLNQVKMFIDSTKSTNVKVMQTIELLERKWVIDEMRMRPEHEMLGHTAFLVFCRRF